MVILHKPERGLGLHLLESLIYLNRYPVNVVSREQISADAFKEAECPLKEEEEDPNPDPQVYLPLMKSTFDFRRQYVVSEAESAFEIMEKYSFFWLEDVVSIVYVMCFI